MPQPSQSDLAAEALDISISIERLRPDWNNPERFHFAKSELAARMRRLHRQLRGRR
ncbi:hypothetical protein [Sphingomonas oleivorans]|uniref:hypothetical protein n=1 Tax=Sphingomonas oleivorans TaxID=1735121 RepID=UPI0013FD499A|nr:hypothetical protein [Sphingomonas oleivorans]